MVRRRWLVGLLGFIVGAGCEAVEPRAVDPMVVPSSAGLPAADLGEVVARVGGVPIHAAEVEAQMARTGSSATAAVDELVRFHLLAERARERGHVGPEAPPKSLLVERLLERDFEPRTGIADIPESELRETYQKNKVAFVHPRMVEVALLSIYTGPAMKPEPRKERTRSAHALAAYVADRRIESLEAFEEIGKDPRWVDRKVRFRRFWQGPNQDFGPFRETVAAAIHRLSRPGQMSGLIVDESGFHIARYISEEPPSNRSFEEVRAELAEKIHPHWQKDAFNKLAGSLAAKYQVKTYPDRVSRP